MGDPPEQFVETAPGIRSATLLEESEFVQVYRGQLHNHPRDVRILALAPGHGETATAAFTRAASEWQNASTHPNIVAVIRRDETPRPWIAVEYPPGETLGSIREELTPGDIAKVVSDTAEALRNAALYNTYHPALVPAHILVEQSSGGVTAFVDDWGLQYAVRRAANATPESRNIAPELEATPETGHEKAGVYGLGVIAYFALTGTHPAIGAEEIPPPGEFDPSLSPEVDDIVLQALAADPAERPDSAYVFKDSFERAYSPPPSPSASDEGERGFTPASTPPEESDESADSEGRTDTPGPTGPDQSLEKQVASQDSNLSLTGQLKVYGSILGILAPTLLVITLLMCSIGGVTIGQLQGVPVLGAQCAGGYAGGNGAASVAPGVEGESTAISTTAGGPSFTVSASSETESVRLEWERVQFQTDINLRAVRLSYDPLAGQTAPDSNETIINSASGSYRHSPEMAMTGEYRVTVELSEPSASGRTFEVVHQTRVDFS